MKHARLLLLLLVTLCSFSLSDSHAAAQKRAVTHRSHQVRKTSSRKAPQAQGVKVWVNTNSGVYHFPGQRWYGNTKAGEYMSEADAKKHGYRSTQNGQ
jgi:hypothetical protein